MVSHLVKDTGKVDCLHTCIVHIVHTHTHAHTRTHTHKRTHTRTRTHTHTRTHHCSIPVPSLHKVLSMVEIEIAAHCKCGLYQLRRQPSGASPLPMFPLKSTYNATPTGVDWEGQYHLKLKTSGWLRHFYSRRQCACANLWTLGLMLVLPSLTYSNLQ